MSPALLGARLDGEVVLLDPTSARLFHLDPWTLRVWEACDGRDAWALAGLLASPVERVNETLLSLADASVIRPDGQGWTRLEVRWV